MMRSFVHKIVACVALIVASLLIGIFHAKADVVLLPPRLVINAANMTQGDGGVFSSGPVSAAVSANGQTATVTAKLQPSPSISATASTSGATPTIPPQPQGATALGNIIYYFAVIGEPGSLVPVTISGSGFVDAPSNPASGSNRAVLWWRPESNPIENLIAAACQSADASFCTDLPDGEKSSFNAAVSPALLSNTSYAIAMLLSLSSVFDQFYPGDTVSGFLDPIITIDPEFADNFHLVFSEGVGNSASAVPLPAALPLFAGGLGLLGWMARRRRGQAAHA